MKTIKLIILSVFLVPTIIAQQPDSSSALFSMREAEWNFARQSVMFGRNEAFIRNFAEKSITFTDKWLTNSLEYLKQRKPAAIVLKWEPEYMDISESRDFGISTGPWEMQEFRPNTSPLSTGYFLTVWKKQEDGIWKVILDAGCSTPAKTGNTHKFQFPAGSDKAVNNPEIINTGIEEKKILAEEQELSNVCCKDQLSTVFIDFLSEGARFQLNGHLPSTNTDTIRALISGLDNKLAWIPSGAGVASSGDLGYTYGLLQNTGNQPVTMGHYVTIWKKQQGKWRISLEMMNLN
jgi:ketosteroid isomerase-like protein